MTTNVYELIYMIKQNDESAYNELFNMYKLLINKIVCSTISEYPSCRFFKEDIQQEVYISLIDIVYSYRDDLNANFKTFLYICVLRKIKTLIKHYTSNKCYAHLNSISLDGMINDELQVMEMYENNDKLSEPEYRFTYNEASNKFKKYYSKMSVNDKLVLNMLIKKVDYNKAASILNWSKKKYDNNVQKIKRNIRNAIYAD